MMFWIGMGIGVFLGAALGFLMASLCVISRSSVDRDCAGWEDTDA